VKKIPLRFLRALKNVVFLNLKLFYSLQPAGNAAKLSPGHAGRLSRTFPAMRCAVPTCADSTRTSQVIFLGCTYASSQRKSHPKHSYGPATHLGRSQMLYKPPQRCANCTIGLCNLFFGHFVPGFAPQGRITVHVRLCAYHTLIFAEMQQVLWPNSF